MSELTCHSTTGSCEWRTCPRSLRGDQSEIQTFDLPDARHQTYHLATTTQSGTQHNITPSVHNTIFNLFYIWNLIHKTTQGCNKAFLRPGARFNNCAQFLVYLIVHIIATCNNVNWFDKILRPSGNAQGGRPPMLPFATPLTIIISSRVHCQRVGKQITGVKKITA